MARDSRQRPQLDRGRRPQRPVEPSTGLGDQLERPSRIAVGSAPASPAQAPASPSPGGAPRRPLERLCGAPGGDEASASTADDSPRAGRGDTASRLRPDELARRRAEPVRRLRSEARPALWSGRRLPAPAGRGSTRGASAASRYWPAGSSRSGDKRRSPAHSARPPTRGDAAIRAVAPARLASWPELGRSAQTAVQRLEQRQLGRARENSRYRRPAWRARASESSSAARARRGVPVQVSTIPRLSSASARRSRPDSASDADPWPASSLTRRPRTRFEPSRRSALVQLRDRTTEDQVGRAGWAYRRRVVVGEPRGTRVPAASSPHSEQGTCRGDRQLRLGA